MADELIKGKRQSEKLVDVPLIDVTPENVGSIDKTTMQAPKGSTRKLISARIGGSRKIAVDREQVSIGGRRPKQRGAPLSNTFVRMAVQSATCR